MLGCLAIALNGFHRPTPTTAFCDSTAASMPATSSMMYISPASSWRIQQRFSMACFGRLWKNSHLGDSRIHREPMKRRPEGINWIANGIIHCERLGFMCCSTPY